MSTSKNSCSPVSSSRTLRKTELTLSLAALAFSTLALTACSGTKDGALIHPGTPANRNAGNGGKKDPVTPAGGILSINDKWTVGSKTCNGASLNLDLTESFSMDFTHLARTTMDDDSKTDKQYCEDIYLYTRTPVSAETVNGTFTESATTQSKTMIRDCYRINKGHVVRGQPISHDETDFGPESFQTVIVANATSIELTLVKPTDCPSGNMVFKLQKAKK